MPITGPIPLPMTGMQALFSGATNTQNILNNIMSNSRANRLTPAQLTEYADKHKKAAIANYLNQQAIEAAKNQGQGQPTQSSMQTNPMEFAQGEGFSNLPNYLLNPSQSGVHPNANVGASMGDQSRETVVHPGNQNLYFHDKLAGTNNIPEVKFLKGPNNSLLKVYPSGKVTRLQTGEGESQFQSPFGKAVADYNRLVKQYGADDPIVKQGLSYLDKVAAGSGTSVSIDPSTGLINVQTGTKGAPKSGFAVDDKGNVVQSPTTSTLNSQQNRMITNRARDVMTKYVPIPYLGLGSTKKALEDLATVNMGFGDKNTAEARQRLINLVALAKLTPEMSGYILGANNLPKTKNIQMHIESTLKQGWPLGWEKIVNNLPEDILREGAQKFNEANDAINKNLNDFVIHGFATTPEGGSLPSTSEQKAAATSERKMYDKPIANRKMVRVFDTHTNKYGYIDDPRLGGSK